MCNGEPIPSNKLSKLRSIVPVPVSAPTLAPTYGPEKSCGADCARVTPGTRNNRVVASEVADRRVKRMGPQYLKQPSATHRKA